MSAARLAFALTLIALGALSLVQGDFATIWAGADRTTPGRLALVYATAMVSLGGGLGLFWPRTTQAAACLLASAFLVWLLMFKLGPALARPLAAAGWENCGESLVMTAGALALAPGSGDARGAQIGLGLAVLPLGLAHLVYLKETAGLVPGWIPGPRFWAAATGLAYLAAGPALMTRRWIRPAAVLVALQMTGFTLLVWGWRLVEGVRFPTVWGEAADSLALTVAAWAVAAATISGEGRS